MDLVSKPYNDTEFYDFWNMSMADFTDKMANFKDK